jgi:GH15 family glucan-1,4-alpha-glucosidase
MFGPCPETGAVTGRHPLAARCAPAAVPFQPPIERYAIIGDCRTAALVSHDGAIAWLCLPNYDSGSIFAHIISPTRGGRCSIRPTRAFTSARRYLDFTPVLETTFETENGSARLIDFLPVTGDAGSLEPMREIQRTIEGISGTLDLEILIDPRPDYGRAKPRIEHRGRCGWCYSWSNEILLLCSEVDLQPAASELRATVRVCAGNRIHLSLAYVKADIGVLPLLGEQADARLKSTLDWWKGWSSGCSYAGPYRNAVLRSALTLKLLTHVLSGATVAAPTTSLPEAIGAERNWDYRFCWLRDAGMTMQAFIGLGFHDEACSFLNWLLHATRLTRPELRVMYDIYGRAKLPEIELQHFEGYRGSKPVRIGNRAYLQRQLDVYGEVIIAANAYVKGGGTLEPAERRMLAKFAKAVCAEWREPDHSIWELPSRVTQHTFSKLMCWVALDRLLKLEEERVLSLGRLAARIRSEREAIAQAIEQRAYNSRIESYVSELDGDEVDASLLVIPFIGYKPASDPRVVSTYERIWQRLGSNGLLHRYKPGHDRFTGREGAFGVCNFWAAHHLACRGDVPAARRVFDHLLAFSNDLSLFAEEIDPETGAALGNFPQAFTHVGLINAALAIEHAAKRARSADV